MGEMYRNGHGVSCNLIEAARWFREAALQGHVDAQVNLGLLYVTGRGVEADMCEALYWFREAAGRGDPQAKRTVDLMLKHVAPSGQPGT